MCNFRSGLLVLILWMVTVLTPLPGQGLVVNEVGTGDNGFTFLELVVVGAPCSFNDITGWIIDDNNGDFVASCQSVALGGAGISDGFVRFSENELWKNLPSGTIIVLYEEKNAINPAEILFCDDYIIEMNLSSPGYFEKNTISPKVSTSGTICENRNCNSAKGSHSYDFSRFTPVASKVDEFTDLSGVIALRRQGDGIQIRDDNGGFYHGIAWGEADFSGCSHPGLSGGPNNILLPTPGNYGLSGSQFNNFSNWSNNLPPTPGIANSVENANWIVSMRYPLGSRVIDVNCGIDIGSISVCVGEEVSYFIGGCAFNNYDWSYTGSNFTISPVQNSDELVIRGLLNGTGLVSVNITNKYIGLTSGNNHKGLDATHQFEVNVIGYDAKFDASATDLCVGGCEVVSIMAPAGTYDVGFTIGGIPEFINNLNSNQKVTICLDEPGINPDYDDVTKTIHIPMREAGSTIDLTMDFIQENGAKCEGSPASLPITFNLLPGIITNDPSPLDTCDLGGYAKFDLTRRNHEIAPGMQVIWYEDTITNKSISAPKSYLVVDSVASVFARATNGTCLSPPVQMDLSLSQQNTGHFTIISTFPTINCDSDGLPGEDVTFKVIAPKPYISYNTQLAVFVDESPVVFDQPILDSFIIDFKNINDSLTAYVLRAELPGTCRNFVGTTDTLRIYNDYRPEAGRDTTMVKSNRILDLPKLFPGSSQSGVFEMENNPALNLGSKYDLAADTSMDLTILHIVSDICGNDTARANILTNNCPMAGLDTSIVSCGSFAFTPQNLVRESSNVGFFINDAEILPTTLLGVNPGNTLEILVITDSMLNCTLDTAFLRIQANSIEYAGLDTSLTICNTQINLPDLLRQASTIGVFQFSDGTPLNEPIVDFTQVNPGIYNVFHIVGAQNCGFDTATIQLDVNVQDSAGMDTVLLNCGLGFFTPLDYLRDGILGDILYNGSVIPADTTLVFQGSATATIKNVISAVGSCDSDTAYYLIINEREPDAGLDVDTFICESGTYDLRDFLKDADEEGTFSDFIGNNLNSSIIEINYGDDLLYRYVARAGFCGSDNSVFMLKNYSLEGTVADLNNSLVCNDECITITFPFPFEGYELHYTLVNNLTNDEYPRVKNFFTGPDTIQLCNIINGIESHTDLEPGNSYRIRVDSVLFSNACLLTPNWDNLEFTAARHVNELLDPELCLGETILVGDEVFDENRLTGSVTLSGMAANGCDSIVEVSLTYVDYKYGSIIGDICRGDTLIFNGSAYTAEKLSGLDTLLNAASGGCDSVVSVDLNLLEPSFFLLEREFCDHEETLEVQGSIYGIDNPNGLEIIDNGNAVGCDSIIEISIEYLNPGLASLDTSICNDNFTLSLNGDLYDINNRSGVTVIAGAAANGCDSIVMVNIVFEELMVDYEVNQPDCPGDTMGSIVITQIAGELPVIGYIGDSEISINVLPFSHPITVNVPTLIELSDINSCGTLIIEEVGFRAPLIYEIQETEIQSNIYQLELITEEEINYYEWYPDQGLSCTECSVPEITLSGDQIVELYAETAAGCIITDSILLRLDIEKAIFTPNIFSPNRDGVNDNWTIYTFNNLAIPIKSVQIFDRWGSRVYDLSLSAINNPSEGWNGAEHTSGVYVYRIEYEERTGQSAYLIGDLTLIR